MLTSHSQLDQWGPADARMLYFAFWLKPCASLVKKQYGVAWPESLCIFDHDRVTIYWDKAKLQRQGEIALAKWIISDKNREKLYAYYKALLQKGDRLSKKSLKDKQMLVLQAALWYEWMMSLWTLTLVPEIANFSAPLYLEKQLEKYISKENLNEALEALLAPPYLSFGKRAELELYKNARDSKLSFYAKKWYWIESTFYESKIIKEHEFKKQLEGLSKKELAAKIKAIEQIPRNIQKKKLEFYKKYKLPSYIKILGEAMAFSIFWQDHRLGTVRWAQTITDKYSAYAASVYKIDSADILYYIAEEWRDLTIKGKLVAAEEINLRKKFCVVYITRNGYKIYTGKYARTLAKPFITTAAKDVSTIKGTVVSRGATGIGKIKGRVRVIMSARQIGNIAEGEILVAPMTLPDYVPAMKKAIAVITDVGGLTSHAAVVSRELGIPCIVGTKIATSVLKDGDRVEVDVEKGTITKSKYKNQNAK